jgi:hypothetical protein
MDRRAFDRDFRPATARPGEVSRSRPIYGDAILIHEMLHALGLSEDAPVLISLKFEVCGLTLSDFRLRTSTSDFRLAHSHRSATIASTRDARQAGP